jgi:hypothetical protein
MGVSQILYEAIQELETELKLPAMAADPRRKEIVALLDQMKTVQEKLDAELTEIDDGDPN